MRIVIVGPAYPLRGGIVQFSAMLYQKLESAGHDVKFVSFTKQFPEWLFPGKTQLESSKEIIDVHPTATFAPLGVLSWTRTAREVAKHNPDLVIFKWWMPFFGLGYGAVTRGFKKRTQAKILYILDNVIPHERRPGDKFLTKSAFTHVDNFIAQSRAVERDFFTWFPNVSKDRVAFSPHPVYDSYPKFVGSQIEARKAVDLPLDGKLLLFFGFVRQYKGLDILLRAMPDIRAKLGDVKMVVVGEFYDPRETYDKLIRELKIEDSVIIRDDYCPNEFVGTYFAACDCVVLPYRSATQSGIIQVAYALDTPVITTNVGGLGEVVVDGVTGFVTEPENSIQIASAVDKFFTAGGRAVFEANVRKEAGKYSWEGFVKTIEDLTKA